MPSASWVLRIPGWARGSPPCSGPARQTEQSPCHTAVPLRLCRQDEASEAGQAPASLHPLVQKLISPQHALRHTQDQVQPNTGAPLGPSKMSRELATTHHDPADRVDPRSTVQPTAPPRPPQVRRWPPVLGTNGRILGASCSPREHPSRQV